MQTTRNVPIIEIKVCGVERMDMEREEDIHVTLIGISISYVEEVYMEMEKGNKGLMAMILNSIVVVPTIEDVTTLRLAIKLQLSTIPMAWAFQDQVMIE